MSYKAKVLSKTQRIGKLAEVGQSVENHKDYPAIHETYGNTDVEVIHSTTTDAGLVQVIGDRENGHYEWCYFRDTGVLDYTACGFSSPGFCLLQGLKHAFTIEGHNV